MAVSILCMYSKLFAKITDSSLMEEPIVVRYVFAYMLALSNRHGAVTGTDLAIARKLNMPLDDFRGAIAVLMAPDPNSNCKEHEGRRIIVSEGEVGYEIVNYVTYHRIRNEDERRDYMRDYMRERRRKEKGRPESVEPYEFEGRPSRREADEIEGAEGLREAQRNGQCPDEKF